MDIYLKYQERKWVIAIIDIIIILFTVTLALWIHAIRNDVSFNKIYLLRQIGWYFLLSVLWFFSATINGLYDLTKIVDFDKTILLLLRSVFIILGIYLLVFFFTAPSNLLPRGIVLYQSVTGFIGLGFWRLFLVFLNKRPEFARPIIIIGAGRAGQSIAEKIAIHARYQFRIIGFVDDNEEIQDRTLEILGEIVENEDIMKEAYTTSLPVLGTSEDLVKLVKEYRVPEVILAVTNEIQPNLFKAILDCKELGVDITLMPILYEDLTGRVPVDHIGDNWFVTLPLKSVESGGFYNFFNRVFDVLGALIGIILLLPLFPIISLAIYIDSPGSIIYSQSRIGKGGKIFNLHKLRTMIPEAEKGGKAIRAQMNDPRITKVGRWLRKFRLDEMPQLINILKGEMSAVGPRPERLSHLVELDKKIPFHRLRNAVKPGMAGWAVVNYGYIDSLESAKIRLQYDLFYVKHQSLWLDMVILWRTMVQMITLKGR